MNVQTKLNEAISLSDTPFAKGGEGALYDVVSPANLSHLCAKIYHVEKRDKEKEDNEFDLDVAKIRIKPCA